MGVTTDPHREFLPLVGLYAVFGAMIFGVWTMLGQHVVGFALTLWIVCIVVRHRWRARGYIDPGSGDVMPRKVYDDGSLFFPFNDYQNGIYPLLLMSVFWGW